MKCLICQARHTKNKSGKYFLGNGLSFGVFGFSRYCILIRSVNITKIPKNLYIILTLHINLTLPLPMMLWDMITK